MLRSAVPRRVLDDLEREQTTEAAPKHFAEMSRVAAVKRMGCAGGKTLRSLPTFLNHPTLFKVLRVVR